MIIKVMTYNIQHGLDYSSRIFGQRVTNFEGLKDTICSVNPDILSINEIYGKGFVENSLEYFDQVTYLANLLGYPYYYFSKAIDAKNGEYGNALFSKIPFIKNEVIKIKDPIKNPNYSHYESRVLTKFDFGFIDLISTHVGLNPDEQENAYYAIVDTIDFNKKTVILGDFNMTVDNRFIKLLMKQYNETTIFANDEVKNTYPSIDSRMKIDYIFTSKDIKIMGSDVVESINSDHMPIYAILSI